MKKEIKELQSGKSLGFMALVSEKLGVKSAAEYEVFKMSVASKMLKEEELSDKQKKLDVDGDGDIEGDDLADLRKDKKKSDEKKD